MIAIKELKTAEEFRELFSGADFGGDDWAAFNLLYKADCDPMALSSLLIDAHGYGITSITFGDSGCERLFPQKTQKERLIAALDAIISKEKAAQ